MIKTFQEIGGTEYLGGQRDKEYHPVCAHFMHLAERSINARTIFKLHSIFFRILLIHIDHSESSKCIFERNRASEILTAIQARIIYFVKFVC